MHSLAVLPNELLELIAANLGNLSHLNDFARTSTHLYHLFNRSLYRRHVQEQGGMALTWAAIFGMTGTTRRLLEVESNGPCMVGWIERALFIAVAEGKETIVEMLLDTGRVNVNLATHFTVRPICNKATCHQAQALELLFEQDGTDSNDKFEYFQKAPLWWAVTLGHEEVVKLLLSREDLDLDANRCGCMLLQIAAGLGRASIAELLLATGRVDADCRDRSGRTPLSWAAERGHVGVVKLLLSQAGVDPNSQCKYGYSPLMMAITSRTYRSLDLLYEDSVEQLSETITPLVARILAEMRPTRGDCKAVIKLLLSTNTVDANLPESGGITPLMEAVNCGWFWIVRELLSMEAVVVNATDLRGRTALAMCPATHPAIAQLLRDHGAVSAL